jgi:GNAT superfamily N-acetyltransferase
MEDQHPNLNLTIEQWTNLAPPELLAHFTAGYDTTIWNKPTFASMLTQAQQTSPVHLYLVREDGQPAALFGLLPFPEEDTPTQHALETLVYTHPDHRRHGIARTLTHSAAHATHALAIPLWADVQLEHVESLTLHQCDYQGHEKPGTIATPDGHLGYQSPHGYLTRRWHINTNSNQPAAHPDIAAHFTSDLSPLL